MSERHTFTPYVAALDHRAVADFYLAGGSLAETAEKYGISRTTVEAILEAQGAQTRSVKNAHKHLCANCVQSTGGPEQRGCKRWVRCRENPYRRAFWQRKPLEVKS